MNTLEMRKLKFQHCAWKLQREWLFELVMRFWNVLDRKFFSAPLELDFIGISMKNSEAEATLKTNGSDPSIEWQRVWVVGWLFNWRPCSRKWQDEEKCFDCEEKIEKQKYCSTIEVKELGRKAVKHLCAWKNFWETEADKWEDAFAVGHQIWHYLKLWFFRVDDDGDLHRGLHWKNVLFECIVQSKLYLNSEIRLCNFDIDF